MKSKEKTTGFLIPLAPSELCFDRDEFVKDDFSVDKFIQEHRKQVQLEALRDDLGVYLKILRSAMIELINKDYADFVNLSSNLIGLDKAIIGLQIPLGQLREEVLHVKAAADETILELKQLLEHRRQIREKKSNLQNVMQIISCLKKMDRLLNSKGKINGGSQVSLEADLLERVASEFNHLQFCVNKCPKEYLVDNMKEHIDQISHILDYNIERMFMDSLQRESQEELIRCLRIYATLDKISSAELLFRKRYVDPYMNEAISESSLSADPQGLRGLYCRVLNFVPACMKEILEVTSEGHRAPVVKGFNFLVNSVWPEVATKLQERLFILFSPGNPELFYARYTLTTEFIHQFEECCNTRSAIKLLRSHPNYKSFLDCWNLPVYFQIRFQEIGGDLELTIYDADQDVSIAQLEDSGLHHPVSRTLWKCVHQCWQPGIYLPGVAHRFWKLTLQLLARYCTWVTESLKQQKGLGSKSNGNVDSASNYGSIQVNLEPKRQTQNHKQLRFLVCLFADIQRIVKLIPSLLETIFEKLHSLEFTKDVVIKGGMSESESFLLSICPLLTKEITGIVCDDCCQQLRQVGDIPRLFRRTNREVPFKPCTYVSSVLSPLDTFWKEHGDLVPKEQLKEWMICILRTITKQYYSAVSDVLTSIQRMEESLRRLKKARDKTGGSAMDQHKGMTDDDKIRHQLALDVESYIAEAEKMGIHKEEIEKLPELWELVDGARKTTISGDS